jgi:hypothetical protein
MSTLATRRARLRRSQIRHELGIGLTLALAATALSGTSVLAVPAPLDTTTASGAESILPPSPGRPTGTYSYPVNGTMIVQSPETGRNVRVPAFESPLAQLAQDDSPIITQSPETGRTVRVPAI